MAFKNVDSQIHDFLTPKGREALAFAKKYGLENYYDEMSNVYSIPLIKYNPEHQEGLFDKVNKFLKDTPNYTLHQDVNDDGEGVVLVYDEGEW